MDIKDNNLAFKIKSLNNQIRRLFEKSAFSGAPTELTGLQYGVIHFISDNGKKSIYQRDIEAEFNIRRSTASQMLKSLEGLGAVVRETELRDARLKKIRLTEKGKKLADAAKSNVEKIQRRLMRGIDEKELEQFLATLDKIYRNAGE